MRVVVRWGARSWFPIRGTWTALCTGLQTFVHATSETDTGARDTPSGERRKPVSETRLVAAILSLSCFTVPGMTSYRYGYVRVSTLEQDPASQLDAMAAAGVDRDRVFLEHASGALDSRPELAKLVKVLRAGDTLVVWRLDRLGRSTSHLIQTVTELGERGVGFHSLTEAIDTTTSAGRLLFGILASLAAFERDVIRERTVAGLAAARARGNLGGRPSMMTPEKLAVARQMLSDGKPKSVIAKTIGVSRPTLYNHLSRDRAISAL